MQIHSNFDFGVGYLNRFGFWGSEGKTRWDVTECFGRRLSASVLAQIARTQVCQPAAGQKSLLHILMHINSGKSSASKVKKSEKMSP